MMDVAGYFMALIIGVSLGLIGGGGSILAVPVFAYMFYLDEKVATAYSLFVVGFAALIGGLRQHGSKNVDWRTAIVFGIPAIIGVWLIRHYVIPILPDVLFAIDEFEFTRRMGMFGLFAILMVWAAISMLMPKKGKGGTGEVKYNYPLILAEGLVVGAITGFVGAGGGFLIIPALVILANLEIKKAIGTSLIIIALKSILGFFLGDAFTMQIDWQFLFIFTAIAIAGIFLGVFIGKFIEGQKLKKGFGYFIVVMAVFVFIMEFFVNV
jgi:uncharacterized membrane protein YfcA